MINRKEKIQREEPAEDLNLLDDLIRKCYDGLVDEMKEKPKLGDFLKMIELRRKLTPEDASQKRLWKQLEKVRQDTLGKKSDADKESDTQVTKNNEKR